MNIRNFHFLVYFRITALGARGGTGISASEASGGGYVDGKFNLTEGEKIYIVVGQPGTNACSSGAVSIITHVPLIPSLIT